MPAHLHVSELVCVCVRVCACVCELVCVCVRVCACVCAQSSFVRSNYASLEIACFLRLARYPIRFASTYKSSLLIAYVFMDSSVFPVIDRFSPVLCAA